MTNSTAIIQELFQLFESANPDFYKIYKEKVVFLSREERNQLTDLIHADMEVLSLKLDKLINETVAVAA